MIVGIFVEIGGIQRPDGLWEQLLICSWDKEANVDACSRRKASIKAYYSLL